MKIYLISILLLSAIITASAETMDFSYNYYKDSFEEYGFGRRESYDVAVRLDNPSFVGTSIKSMRVPLTNGNISATSAWITTNLSLKKVNGKNINNPDVCCQEATITNGWLEVTFSEPYVIPENGCYVGYSFTVDEVDSSNSSPVSVAGNANPDGLFIHSSRTKLKWTSISEEIGKSSALIISLEGRFPEFSAKFDTFTIVGELNKNLSADIEIINCGTAPITDLSCVYTLGSYCGRAYVILDSPIDAGVARRGSAMINLDPSDVTGTFPLYLTIDKVNGHPIEGITSEGLLKILPFVPVARPLVEEYTGLWCGYCPRGYVALERMKEEHGDLFIGAAFHDGDPMEMSGPTPSSPSGLPTAYINRDLVIGLDYPDALWESKHKLIPEAGIYSEIEWCDASRSAITCKAITKFVEDHKNADFRISFMLIADNLNDPTWLQSNAYSGGSVQDYPFMNNEWGRIFLDGNSRVSDLVFNDVVIAATDYSGIPYSVPSEIEGSTEYPHSYTFQLDGIRKKLLEQPDYLRVIAVLTDAKTGKFVNCCSSSYISGIPFGSNAGIEDMGNNQSVIELCRYSIDGHIIDRSTPGINIIRYSDGSVRKIMVRYIDLP